MIINFLTTQFPFELKDKTRLPIDLDRVGVIILAGGEGKRLQPLTNTKCKPTLNFGGRYSLIDVPISLAISSGLKKIYVIGQYLANTLQDHLLHTYLNLGILDLHMMVPEEREGKMVWYKGTADAIRQNLTYFSQMPFDYFLILSGDQLYNLDFQKIILFGLEQDAAMVIAAQPVSEKDARRMGVMKIEYGGSKVIDFFEKPQDKESIERFETDPLTLHNMGYDQHNGKKYLGSMGIYFFKREALLDLLRSEEGDDFGKHLIKAEMKKGNVHAYLYDGYWEDIGTIESYYHANLALTKRYTDDTKTGFQCYNETAPILTESFHLPSAKIRNALVTDSIICEGAIVEAKEIRHSIIGHRVHIQEGCVIHDSILIGNEHYETPVIGGERKSAYTIGKNCRITKAIIDENVIIGENVELINKYQYINHDAPHGIFVRDGIIVVPRGTVIPDNFVF